MARTEYTRLLSAGNFDRRLQVSLNGGPATSFCVQEHNSRLPHSAFRGQTPDEMYFKTGDRIPEELETARQKARQARAEANRKQECESCELLAPSLN